MKTQQQKCDDEWDKLYADKKEWHKIPKELQEKIKMLEKEYREYMGARADREHDIFMLGILLYTLSAFLMGFFMIYDSFVSVIFVCILFVLFCKLFSRSKK